MVTVCPPIIAKQIEEDLTKWGQERQRWHLVATIANKKPIAIATNNLEKTHPKTVKFNPMRKSHAEMICINKAPKGKLHNAVMTVVRWGKDDTMRIAKPCDMCMEFIIAAGIKKVIYSTDENTFEEIRI